MKLDTMTTRQVTLILMGLEKLDMRHDVAMTHEIDQMIDICRDRLTADFNDEDTTQPAHREYFELHGMRLDDIRRAVIEACRYWRNAGGDETPKELLARAFNFIRTRLQRGMHIQAAVGQLEADAARYMDM